MIGNFIGMSLSDVMFEDSPLGQALMGQIWM